MDAAALEHGFLQLPRIFPFSTIPPVFHNHTSPVCNRCTVTLATEGILQQNISLSVSLHQTNITRRKKTNITVNLTVVEINYTI
jgi:hypothetical protein